MCDSAFNLSIPSSLTRETEKTRFPPLELPLGHDVFMHSTMVLQAIEALHFRGKWLTTLLLFPH